MTDDADRIWERKLLDVVRFMHAFHTDIAEVLKGLDEKIQAEGWECVSRKGVLEGSASFEDPKRWLRTNPKRLWFKPRRALIVNVDFSPPEVYEWLPEDLARPLIYAAAFETGRRFKPKRFHWNWLTAGWEKDEDEWRRVRTNGPIVTAKPSPDDPDRTIDPTLIERCHVFHLPIRAVHDEESLQQLIVEPLLMLAKSGNVTQIIKKRLIQAGAIDMTGAR